MSIYKKDTKYKLCNLKAPLIFAKNFFFFQFSKHIVPGIFDLT